MSDKYKLLHLIVGTQEVTLFIPKEDVEKLLNEGLELNLSKDNDNLYGCSLKALGALFT